MKAVRAGGEQLSASPGFLAYAPTQPAYRSPSSANGEQKAAFSRHHHATSLYDSISASIEVIAAKDTSCVVGTLSEETEGWSRGLMS